MKINGPSNIQAVYGTQRAGRRAATQDSSSSGPAAQVGLSAEASWISALREEANGIDGNVRADVVAETRAQLQNGTLDADVDMDRVLDSLLGEL
ncbi:MAG: flagellar biosynthesis anti-sigma factor FlgM [Proteobacteria bacterium]|nr:flagellar biosynthesis anti-sigma factor FlgM [Pseudomonadota bacterium]MCP4921722.1 flagellar biosynthesis anti-sigma factor FlgM [Pseudomonadota bacterium]